MSRFFFNLREATAPQNTITDGCVLQANVHFSRHSRLLGNIGSYLHLEVADDLADSWGEDLRRELCIGDSVVDGVAEVACRSAYNV